MVSEELTQEAIEALNELEADINIPKNIKTKLQEIIDILEEDTELSIKISKVSNDANLEPFTRTQIWNIVSMLEKVNH